MTRRPGVVAALACLGVLAVVSIPVSSASTTGGIAAGTLAAGQAETRGITGVQLDWTPVATAAGWGVGGVSITADPGQEFAAGDTVKLALTGPEVACEPVAMTIEATTAVSISRAVIADACGQLQLDEISSAALSVTGDGVAASFSGDLGEVRGTLAAFEGAVIDPRRSLHATADTAVASGVTYLDALFVEVTADALTPGALAGTRALVELHDSATGADLQYGGAVSLDSSAPIHVTSADGSVVTIAIDVAVLADRAGSPRPQASAFDSFDVILYTPQHLGAPLEGAASQYALSMVSATIEHPGSPGATWAVDAVELDGRLGYQYPVTETNESNSSLSFCHNFTVTNTSSVPVAWELAFDTSLPPLWGFDPTQAGGFRSAWGWQTVSYDPATHLWTVDGPSWAKVLQPGQSASGGYCVDRVPGPALDPATFATSLTVNPHSSSWYASFDLSITGSSRWNVPWQTTVDLADYVCSAGLEDRTVTWSSAVEVVAHQGAVYTLRGVAGVNTRYVSTSKPLTISTVASFVPAGGRFGSACQVAQAATVPSASSLPEPSATPVQDAVEPAVATSTAQGEGSGTPAGSVSPEPPVPEPTGQDAPVDEPAAGASVPAEPASSAAAVAQAAVEPADSSSTSQEAANA